LTKAAQLNCFFASALFSATSLVLAACAASRPPTAHIPSPPEPLPEQRAMQTTAIAADFKTALLMACLSDRAYAEPAPSGVCDRLASLTNYTVSNPYIVKYKEIFGTDKDGEYIIATNDAGHDQIIAIQGTNSIQDWFANIEITPIVDDVLQVPVHRGFQAYARAVQRDIEENRRLSSGYKIYITGHSLGGAAGLLLGVYWYTHNPPTYDVQGIYTFGQPRVFTNRGAASWPYFAQRVFRFEDCYDFVPLIPTGDTLFANVLPSFLGDQEASNYQHLGQSFLLMDNGRYWIPGEIDLDRYRVADINSFIMDARTKQPIDHAITQYIIRIDDIAEPGKSPLPVNPINQFRSVCSPVAPAA
jgi:Lipase (class 3)